MDIDSDELGFKVWDGDKGRYLTMADAYPQVQVLDKTNEVFNLLDLYNLINEEELWDRNRDIKIKVVRYPHFISSHDENKDDLKELRAYKVGYDLGFFRCAESIMPKIDELQDVLQNSSVIREVENEVERNGGERPLFWARVLTLLADIKQLKRELMPTLVLENKAINDLGSRLEKLPLEMFQGDNLIEGFGDVKRLSESGD